MIQNPSQQTELLRTRLLGRGLRAEEITPGFDHGRDLALANGPNGRDLSFVSGMDNLGQDLKIALTTPLGGDVFNTGFGFDGLNALAEETAPVLMRERVRVAVIKLLTRDPRVRRILDVDLGSASPSAPVLARTLEVEVAFETATGEKLNFRLGELNV